MEPTKISSPQGAQSAQGARSRSTASTPEAADAGGGGFLALLAALGTSDATADPLADMGAPADAAPSAPSDEDLDASTVLAAWQGLLGPGANVRADTAGQGAQGAGDSGAFGSGGAGAAGAVAVPSAGLPGVAAMGVDMAYGPGVGQGIVAETAKLDAAGGGRNGLPLAAGGTQGRVFSRLQGAMAQKADAVEVSTGRGIPGPHAQTLGNPSGAVTGGAVLSNLAERLGSGTVSGLVERAPGGLRESDAAGGMATALMEGVSANGQAGSGSGADTRGRPGEGRAEGAVAFDAAGLGALAEAGAVDGANLFADPGPGNLEEQVAEQVAYWVNQTTQNAELTLDRDGQPVEVSVTLSGNEAHVAFRSDQSATRELLDKSMAQLSEMLRGEGLVLSGMSVGTSSGQREQEGEPARQGQRDGGRQARVQAAAPTGASALLRTSAPDRAVDVFV